MPFTCLIEELACTNHGEMKITDSTHIGCDGESAHIANALTRTHETRVGNS